MPALYDDILPLLQAIWAEGGNMSAHLVDKTVLVQLDSMATTDPAAAYLIGKVREALRNYKGKRDHAGFNTFFEAYTEGLFFLAARDRDVALHATPDGKKYGPTPDFVTMTTPSIGMEVKTINAVNPIAAVDDVMNRGFEAGYEAEQRSREDAKSNPRGIGIGFGETTWAPHGEGADLKTAVILTMAKIDGNIKSGQYAARPTFLVVSLARLGLHDRAIELKKWIEDREGGQRSGQLYALAAHELDAPFHGHNRDSYDGPDDLGPLSRAGLLRDHPFIAGIIFIDMVGSEANSVDYLRYAVRFHGIWNSTWERESGHPAEAVVAAKALFDKLCDAWNDLDDTRNLEVVDDQLLHRAFYDHLAALDLYRGQPAAGPAFEACMIEAERLHFVWRAALSKIDSNLNHTARDGGDIVTGMLVDGRSVISWSGGRSHPQIPLMALVQTGRQWILEEGETGPIAAAPIAL